MVTNESVPQRIRQALNVESKLNDGLAFPVLLIVVALAFETDQVRSGEWGLFITRQLTIGPLAGAFVGLVGARLVEYCASRSWMNEVFVRISVLSLAVIAFSGAEALGGNGFIAAFAAGMALADRSRRVLDAVEDFGETEGQLLSLLVFLLFGAILLPLAFEELAWRHLLYALLSLTLIRAIPVAVSLVGTRLLPVTVGFLAWFGPRGLASILYLLLVLEGNELAASSDLVPAVLATVVLSVLLHGITAAPASRRYARYIAARPDTEPEDRSVFPFPTRIPQARAVERPSK